MTAKPITVAEATRQHGLRERTAYRVCDQHSLGVKLTPKVRLLWPSDVRKLLRLMAAKRTRHRRTKAEIESSMLATAGK